MSMASCRTQHRRVFLVLSLSAVFAISLFAAPNLQTITTGIITGRVVDGSSKAAVVEATVALVLKSAQVRGRPAVVTVLTDSTGKFRFEQVPVGSYWVQVTKSGYSPASYRRGDASANEAPITITADSRHDDVIVTLSRLAVISGAVHVVHDDRLRPMPNVTVAALARHILGGREHFLVRRTGKTDEQGTYRIANLAPDQYVVAVQTTATFREGMIYPTTFFPGTPVLVDATRLDLTPGVDRQDVDVVVAPRGTFRVAGAIIGSARSPSSLMVRLMARTLNGPTSDVDVMTVATSSDRRFMFSNVLPGDYVLRVVDAPWQSRASRLMGKGLNIRSLDKDGLPVLPPSGEGDIQWAEVPFSIESRDVTDVQVVLDHGFRLAGHVRFEGQKVRAPDTAPEMQMFVYPTDGAGSSHVAPFELGSGLSIRTPQLPAGRYAIGFLREIEGWTLRSIEIRGRNVAGWAFDLTSDVSDLIVTFSETITSVSGDVIRDQRKPGVTEESYILVFPSDPALWDAMGFMSPSRVRVARTTNGKFSIPLLPGQYALVATQDQPQVDWEQPHHLKELLPVATLVNVSSGHTVLPRGLRMSKRP